MTRYPAYPEYQETGIEWLGEIPSHWDVTAVWTLFELGRGRVISNEEIHNNRGPYPVYSSQTAKQGAFGYINTFDFEGVYLTWTTDGANAGTVFYREGKFNCTNVCGTLKSTHPDVAPKFFGYALNNATAFFVRHDINPKLMNNVMARIKVQLPPLPEQRAIAAFLDARTARLDAAAAEYRRQADLLREQRAALISHAVTQGLDPDVPRKDSGIAWLGEIPSHWEVIKLKIITSVIDGDRGKEYPNENDLVQEGIPFLSSKNIVDNKLDYSEVRFIDRDKFNKLGRGKMVKGDLVITVRGTIGSVGLFTGEEFQTAFINAQMMILRPDSALLAPTFLHYIAVSKYWLTQLEISSYGTAQQQLSNEILSNLVIVVPPLPEQRAIAAFLDEQTARIDAALAEIDAAIGHLEEYRAALIAAAVTGKIDVR